MYLTAVADLTLPFWILHNNVRISGSNMVQQGDLIDSFRFPSLETEDRNRERVIGLRFPAEPSKMQTGPDTGGLAQMLCG